MSISTDEKGSGDILNYISYENEQLMTHMNAVFGELEICSDKTCLQIRYPEEVLEGMSSEDVIEMKDIIDYVIVEDDMIDGERDMDVASVRKKLKDLELNYSTLDEKKVAEALMK